MEEKVAEDEASTSRLEAFSDGVFAVAITLLVLEIQIPKNHDISLARALVSLWPSYIGYLLSFLVIGIYWANHHYIFQYYRKTTHYFNLLNLLLLASICFLPFATGVLSNYVEIPGQEQTAAELYIAALLMPALSWFLMWKYASGQRRLLAHDMSSDLVRSLDAKYRSSLLLYLAALAITFWHYYLGFTLAAGMTLLYLLPTRSKASRRAADAV